MKILEHLAYGRGILLAIVLIGVMIYCFGKKEANNINTLEKII